MSDHEFEKRVKQKMDELRFSPSDAVWSGVQREIGKGRSNRRGWLWIPAMLAVFSVTGYFFMNNNASDKTILNNKTETGPQATNATNDQQTNSTDPKVSLAESGKSATKPGTAVSSQSETDRHIKNNQVDPLREDKNITDKNSAAVNQPGFPPSADHPSASLSEKSRQGKRSPAAQKDAGTVSGSRTTDLADLSISEQDQGAATKAALSGRKQSVGNNNLAARVGKNQSAKAESGKSEPARELSSNQPSSKQGTSNQPASKQRTSNQPSSKQKTGNTEIAKNDAGSKPAGSVSPGDDLAVADTKAKKTTADNERSVADTLLESKTSAQVESATDSAKEADAKNSASKSVVKKNTSTKSAASKNWSWGVSASAGVAKLSDGKITDAFKSSENFDAALATQAPSNNSFMFRPVTAGVPQPKPSKVKPGAYFSVGGFVKKQISKRFALSAGLQYTQHNHLIHTGNRVDSSQLVNNGSQVLNVARYYRADETSKFSNKYHLIELPITLHTQLNRSERFPLIWNLGASVGQLVASNALVFDSGTGVYYKDKSKYNNTQFTMSTGFSFGLFSRSATPLWVGPSVRYNNSRLFITEMKDEKHLFSASLDLRLFLNKK